MARQSLEGLKIQTEKLPVKPTKDNVERETGPQGEAVHVSVVSHVSVVWEATLSDTPSSNQKTDIAITMNSISLSGVSTP